MSSTKMETSQHKHEASTKDIEIEAVVLVALDRRSKMATPRRKGTVRYVGKAGTSNTWLGIELDEKYGKHDGKARNATYYFQCKMGHGIYVRPWHVVLASLIPARSIPERVGGVDSSSSSSPSSTAPSTSMTASTSSSSSKTSSLKQRETVAQLIASVQSLSSIADVKKVQSA
jgi:dynactin complex subunit